VALLKVVVRLLGWFAFSCHCFLSQVALKEAEDRGPVEKQEKEGAEPGASRLTSFTKLFTLFYVYLNS
jgi:hypothetical protein